MINIQNRPVDICNWWTYWVKRPTVVLGPHQVNLKPPLWPIRLVKNSPTPPLCLLGVSFPAPRLNKSLTDHDHTKNSGCNIALTHRWNEKQIARWTGGTFSELGGVKVRDDQLPLCVCEILIRCSCLMIRLIYVATPVLNKSAKANNCARDFRRRE